MRLLFEPGDDARFARGRLARCRDLGFEHEQRRQDADACERSHHQIARRPVVALRDTERTGSARDERRAIADLVGRRHRALEIDRNGLDSPGVDCDVLRRRAESRGTTRRRAIWNTPVEGSLVARFAIPAAIPICANSIQLRLRPSQPNRSGIRNRSTIGDHRNLIEYVSPTQASIPIVARSIPSCAKPGRERLEHQIERQARGEPEEQHRKHGALRIHAERLAPTALLGVHNS